MMFLALNFTLQMCNDHDQLAVAHTEYAKPQLSGLEIASASVPPLYATQRAWKHPGREMKPVDMLRDRKVGGIVLLLRIRP